MAYFARKIVNKFDKLTESFWYEVKHLFSTTSSILGSLEQNCSENNSKFWTFFYYGDLQLLSGEDQLPHLEFPYPLTNGGQQLWHASGGCPLHLLSITFMVESEFSSSRIFSFSLKTWMVGLVADEFFQHDFQSENFRIQQRKNSDWMKVGSFQPWVLTMPASWIGSSKNANCHVSVLHTKRRLAHTAKSGRPNK